MKRLWCACKPGCLTTKVLSMRMIPWHIDYSKWDNIDTDSEPEMLSQQALAPKATPLRCYLLQPPHTRLHPLRRQRTLFRPHPSRGCLVRGRENQISALVHHCNHSKSCCFLAGRSSHLRASLSYRWSSTATPCWNEDRNKANHHVRERPQLASGRRLLPMILED